MKSFAQELGVAYLSDAEFDPELGAVIRIRRRVRARRLTTLCEGRPTASACRSRPQAGSATAYDAQTVVDDARSVDVLLIIRIPLGRSEIQRRLAPPGDSRGRGAHHMARHQQPVEGGWRHAIGTYLGWERLRLRMVFG